MLLSFRQLKDKKRIFRKLTGLSLEEFAEVIALGIKLFQGLVGKEKWIVMKIG